MCSCDSDRAKSGNVVGATLSSGHQRGIYSTLVLQPLVGSEPNPGGTAIPGQLVTETEQAPELYPLSKISLISKGAHGSRIRY